MSKINTEELRLAIQTMTRDQEIYKVLKEELTALGYWRSLKRGDPKAGYQAMRQRLASA